MNYTNTKTMKKAGLILLLIAFLFEVKNPVHAEEFTIEILTNTQATKVITDIDGDRSIWEENQFTGRQIFLRDGSTTKQLTFDQDPVRNVDSKLDGDYVVWVKENGTSNSYIPQVFAYKISTGETLQLTNDSDYNKSDTDVSNGKVVWVSSPRDPQSCCSTDIMLYDIFSGAITQVTNDVITDVSPKISGNLIVWRSGDSQNEIEIYKKDLTTNQTTRITNNNFTENQVDIDGNYLTWYGYDGNDFESYLYNGNQILQLSDNTVNDINPRINGDKVIWDSVGGNLNIYNISNSSMETVSNVGASGVGSNRLAWETTVAEVIITRNILTNEQSLIEDIPFALLGNLFVGDSFITWVGQANGTGSDQIYIAKIITNNTPMGNDIEYSENGVDLAFSQVDNPGNTTITMSNSGTQPPTGFKIGNPPTFYNVSTTATFTGSVEVCISYDDSNIHGNENNLKLMHYEVGTGWVNITSSLNTESNIICGVATSFSEFVIMTQPTIQDLINLVSQMNLQQGIQNSLDAKLQNAQEALDAKNSGNTFSVISKLNAFINEVEAQGGHKITQEQANELHSFGENLISVINGENVF